LATVHLSRLHFQVHRPISARHELSASLVFYFVSSDAKTPHFKAEPVIDLFSPRFHITAACFQLAISSSLMLSATTNPFAPQTQQSMAADLPHYVSGEHIPRQIANTTTSILASSDTVQRRSSRPSTLLSCDSLLAVRLQQEELWKPAKVRHNKSAPSYSVFSAHAAHNAEHLLHDTHASGARPYVDLPHGLPLVEPAIALKSERLQVHSKVSRKPARPKVSHKPVSKRAKADERMPSFASVAPILLQPRRRIRKPRKSVDNWPLSLPFRDASFRENSRFFYADVFKDEARALRVNGFPIHGECS
jgi:hypothetical protein